MGTCITLTKDTPRYKIDKIDCGDTSGKGFMVTEIKTDGSQSCVSRDYATYTLTRSGRTTALYCLMPNFAEGKCYTKSTSLTFGHEIVDCNKATLRTDIKVNKRIDGKADRSLCQSGQTPREYKTEPQRTYCLSPAK